ncbi:MULTISPECIES: CoA ester lyase [unclassified Herbaspirillum]|uniref:HpcH/HpaI aldolase/citrate lyase family protein n=1 Tax=unclassified Herbaspirillum TaxID=2624150 RepID=UPI000E2F5BDE|nr:MULTISPECIES: CoA ester lyase [unclassified Herbaspirillum]RFB70864.1 CoA ester lyase [Herbaspirillum sp. 3R-3a1]TFI08613.1 CoA ester lyase [Herbaspirillum sp. 3R11]TFI15028.1 CoA ester lyase [Herbaspirillum sp. 3R-11]TFI25412.1 CoA ester lyase [Herbaspirillum sp. 3C11]
MISSQLRRPVHTRRSWLFIAGADESALCAGIASGADVLIQDLEDFTPQTLKAHGRILSKNSIRMWKESGLVSAVRINPLEHGGYDDLSAAVAANVDVIMLAKASDVAQIGALDRELTRLERTHGLPIGHIEIVPAIESAAAVLQISSLARSSSRVTAMLMASEDMATDMDVTRTRNGTELAYARSRFFFECAAAKVFAIDCPYTFADPTGAEQDLQFASSIGYKAKSLVEPAQAAVINKLFTPSPAEVALAIRVTNLFDNAQKEGRTRVEMDGHLLEVPTYTAAKRLLARASQFPDA